MAIRGLFPLFNPEEFQGRGKKRAYFEGWYFKVLDASETRAYAFIPGIALDEAGKGHAFIQVLDGKRRSSRYHKFDLPSFLAARGAFEAAIGPNRFSGDSLILDLPELKGELRFEGLVRWPSRWYSPGIMGPYSFAPFMECYHGIVSMDHAVTGSLEIDGETVDFSGGRGYIEKDWGRSFPKAYVWMQSNHFSDRGVSLKASVANIPWMGKSFTGFIAGLWLRDRLLRFTTYNGAELRRLRIDSGRVELRIANKDYLLGIEVTRDSATSLASPIRGFMDGRIEESMTSTIEVSLTDARTGQEVFRDRGRNAAVEVAGDIDCLPLGPDAD
jgi:tocopherol cyclase